MMVMNVQLRWCDLKVVPTSSATDGRFSVPTVLVAPTLWLWIEFEIVGDFAGAVSESQPGGRMICGVLVFAGRRSAGGKQQ